MPKLRVGDLETYYEVRGTGPPLLLIMGWLATLEWWPEKLLCALERRHQVILYDNRGAGRTGDPGGWYSIAQMAGDAAALLDALSIARADILGVSMGGVIAQELALRHPERVGKLVLACTHGGGHRGVMPDRASLRGGLPVLLGPWRPRRRVEYLRFSERLDAGLRREIAARGVRPQLFDWGGLKQGLATLRTDLSIRSTAIRAPTLVLLGERDLLVAPRNSRRLADRIPGARVVSFPGAGHGFFYEEAAAMDRILGEFLSAG
jgi:pimeloyl-ACP methyl ester carboxylesterase